MPSASHNRCARLFAWATSSCQDLFDMATCSGDAGFVFIFFRPFIGYDGFPVKQKTGNSPFFSFR
jgi:hypothetical protein